MEYSYELSDEKAKLIIYLNEKETTELKPLKENDIIKLVVVDDNDNENEIKLENLENFNKKRKYKNIVLRPHKIQKENLLKHNIKVNNNCEIDDSPKIINKII